MSEALLECRRLSLRAGDRLLVQDLSIRVHTAERWVLIGPNGAGKSSLLAAMAGARLPQNGSVLVAGRPASSWGVEPLAAHRALVNDRWFDPFAATVIDTVLTARYRFGADDGARDAAKAALADMDCAGLAGRDVRGLSRGERQRVAIATALAQATPILLLDEPTSHQDPAHQAWVLRQLAAHSDRTVVAVLHDINAAARFATHVLLLSGAGWWQAGPRAEVLTPQSLSTLFGARIRVVGTGHRDVFWVDEGEWTRN
jgi:iron complex transport system ATP-binding protein